MLRAAAERDTARAAYESLAAADEQREARNDEQPVHDYRWTLVSDPSQAMDTIMLCRRPKLRSAS